MEPGQAIVAYVFLNPKMNYKLITILERRLLNRPKINLKLLLISIGADLFRANQTTF